MSRNIAVLGSTGSIGCQTLDVAKHLGVQVEALAVYSNIQKLEEQIRDFNPKYVAVFDEVQAEVLSKTVKNCKVVSGMEGLLMIATLPDVEMLICAMMGAVGILPTLHGIRAGKTIGLANKEVLVSAGDLVMSAAAEHHVDIIPIDSEHSAIFQCLQGECQSTLQRIILTASGGPFYGKSKSELERVTCDDALKHPNWNMGAKITVDSSTMMNKGLEVIEAMMLFGLPLEKVDVMVHPQSIVHGFVEYVDGSMIAQMGAHDMRVPIQYALTYPKRKNRIGACLDFTKYSTLDFFPPNRDLFPCLELAYEAARQRGTLPCFMNAANEILVNRFLSGEISWVEIGRKLELLMNKHNVNMYADLETILHVDQEARVLAAMV